VPPGGKPRNRKYGNDGGGNKEVYRRYDRVLKEKKVELKNAVRPKRKGGTQCPRVALRRERVEVVNFHSLVSHLRAGRQDKPEGAEGQRALHAGEISRS